MVEHMAGPRWARWVNAYAEEFKRSGITQSIIQEDGYVDKTTQMNVLLGPFAGGQSNVEDAIEGEMTAWALLTRQNWNSMQRSRSSSSSGYNDELELGARPQRAASDDEDMLPSEPNPHIPDRERDDDDLDEGYITRLTPTQLATHARLWSRIPYGVEESWIATCRPKFMAFIAAAEEGDLRERGYAFDQIMTTPASGLVRKRGGRRKTVKRLQASLRYSRSNTYCPEAAAPAEPLKKKSEEEIWKAKLAIAVELANQGHLRRAVQTLTRSGIAPPTRKNISILRAKNRTVSGDIPACPDDAPRIIVDDEVLEELIRKSCDGRKGGASGWTAELIRTLWPDPVCRQGIILLIQTICNNEFDTHSRFLLTCSMLLGTHKPGSDDLRPLAIGEEFLRLAAKYCFKLDSSAFPDTFEPLQMAIGSPGGSERAMQTIQAAIEAGLNDGHIAIHIDSTNAYNEADRGKMLAEVFGDENMSHTWRIYALIYARPSLLLVCDRGTVVDALQSTNGGKQGDVLAGLGYARLFQPIYEDAVTDMHNVTARAIVDDFTIVGPPREAFTAYDRFAAAALNVGVRVNLCKTMVQQPAGHPTEETVMLATARGLNVKLGNAKYVGGQVGVDDAQMQDWLRRKFSADDALTTAILDRDCPPLLSLKLSKTCSLPKPGYLMRALPLRVTMEPLKELAQTHLIAICSRLKLITPLPTAAQISFQQPGRNGGMGHREVTMYAPAAKWAAAASVAPDVQCFIDASDSKLPFVDDRETCYDLLVQANVAVESSFDLIGSDDEVIPRESPASNPNAPAFHDLPADPAALSVYYGGRHRLKDLQRSLTWQIENHIYLSFLESKECSEEDVVRLHACQQRYAGFWVNSWNAYVFSERQALIAIRLRLGLPPFADAEYERCPLCSSDMQNDQWHAFSCVKTRRKAVTTRHDALLYLLCKFARSNCCLARVEPKDEASLVPDGEIHLPGETVLIDVSATYPNAPSYRHRSAQRLGSAIATRESTKANKYDEHSRSRNARFVPFVMCAYGGYGKEAIKLINLIENEAFHPGLGLPASCRMSKTVFATIASCLWQCHNANIIIQWYTMIRAKNLKKSRIADAIARLRR
jgi:hypothetical protein